MRPPADERPGGSRSDGSPPAALSVVDTIVAPSTPAGPGARAAVRLSGPDSALIVERVLAVTELPAPGRAGRGRLDLGGVALDVILLRFVAPRSFTGEDVTEIHLPGWPPVVTELVARLVTAGARLADRGEFTRRALASGRLDLAQAVAVGRLAAARSVEEAAAAAAVLTGALAARHASLREALLDALALIEAHVDFEEEDTEAVTEGDLRERLQRARLRATELLQSAVAAPPADGETDVAFVGAPNVGKSSLLLSLCPGARTSVSPVAGTTRDMLEARVEHDGRRYRLLDGPGVERGRGDISALDERAMDLYVAQLPRAAIVLDVRDATDAAEPVAAPPAPFGARPVVTVWNKRDLLDGPPPARGVAVSALDSSGLAELWAAIAAAAPVPRAPDIAGRRERSVAAAVLPRLEQALSPAPIGDLGAALPEVALLLREAVAELDAAAGESADVDEELLDRIFAGFCVGK